ncbi:alpha/beta hydrolase [Gymnodinialimonas sp. 2305UL16-5]|uniref:alpha/beta fold hydrolase n=1 Tax=Gymnodinialimonas mytili TaxID=3126503 RepID=UPI003098E988
MSSSEPGAIPETPKSALEQCRSVWLHGAGLAGATWDAMIGDLPKATAPDLPGHGDAPLVQPARVETYADAIADTIPPGAVLIGHSLGGMVALELAARLGKDVAALILIEAVPTVRDRISGRISAAIATGLFKSIPPKWFAWLSGLGQSQTTRDEVRRRMAQMDRAHIGAALDASGQYDGRRHLSDIKVPTLVIVGDKQTAAHHGAALFADRIPNANLVMLPGGHMLHTDNPLQLRRTIDEFLRDLQP